VGNRSQNKIGDAILYCSVRLLQKRKARVRTSVSCLESSCFGQVYNRLLVAGKRWLEKNSVVNKQDFGLILASPEPW